jgi:hypothetical protein
MKKTPILFLIMCSFNGALGMEIFDDSRENSIVPAAITIGTGAAVGTLNNYIVGKIRKKYIPFEFPNNNNPISTQKAALLGAVAATPFVLAPLTPIEDTKDLFFVSICTFTAFFPLVAYWLLQNSRAQKVNKIIPRLSRSNYTKLFDQYKEEFYSPIDKFTQVSYTHIAPAMFLLLMFLAQDLH